MDVSGAISATIFSKSKIVTKSSPHWAMPVATPSVPPEIALSGFWMSRQEIRLIPTTLWTRKAMYILLKFVTINRSLACLFTSSPVRYFGRLMTVSTRSLGLKIPSTAGWTCGMAFTGADSMISRTLATLMPYRFSLMVNSMISISLVPVSNRILL